MELQFSDFVHVKITRVYDEESLTHWEVDLKDNKGHLFFTATAPNFIGVLEMAANKLGEQGWTKFDANKRDN